VKGSKKEEASTEDDGNDEKIAKATRKESWRGKSAIRIRTPTHQKTRWRGKKAGDMRKGGGPREREEKALLKNEAAQHVHRGNRQCCQRGL